MAVAILSLDNEFMTWFSCKYCPILGDEIWAVYNEIDD
jgi:hypothetical protein